MPTSDHDPTPPAPVPVVQAQRAEDRWEFDPRTWSILPRQMLSLALNASLKPIERIKAAQVLANLHEQNEWAKAQERAAAARETAAGIPPGTVRVEFDAEALRAAFLGRLAPAGDGGRPGGPADADRIGQLPAKRNRTPKK